MGNPARGADFIAETREQFLVRCGGFRKEFQRHRLAQHQVVSAIDFAHSALAQRSDDAVALAEQRAGKKRPRRRCWRRKGWRSIGWPLAAAAKRWSRWATGTGPLAATPHAGQYRQSSGISVEQYRHKAIETRITKIGAIASGLKQETMMAADERR